MQTNTAPLIAPFSSPIRPNAVARISPDVSGDFALLIGAVPALAPAETGREPLATVPAPQAATDSDPPVEPAEDQPVETDQAGSVLSSTEVDLLAGAVTPAPPNTPPMATGGKLGAVHRQWVEQLAAEYHGIRSDPRITPASQYDTVTFPVEETPRAAAAGPFPMLIAAPVSSGHALDGTGFGLPVEPTVELANNPASSPIAAMVPSSLAPQSEFSPQPASSARARTAAQHNAPSHDPILPFLADQEAIRPGVLPWQPATTGPASQASIAAVRGGQAQSEWQSVLSEQDDGTAARVSRPPETNLVHPALSQAGLDARPVLRQMAGESAAFPVDLRHFWPTESADFSPNNAGGAGKVAANIARLTRVEELPATALARQVAIPAGALMVSGQIAPQILANRRENSTQQQTAPPIDPAGAPNTMPESGPRWPVLNSGGAGPSLHPATAHSLESGVGPQDLLDVLPAQFPPGGANPAAALPTHGHGTAVGTAALPNLPQPSPPVAVQVAEAVLRKGEGITELHLSPEELGAVRIGLRAEGDRVVLMLSAERPETQDLLRRHAERLASELRMAGFQQIDMGFQSWNHPSGAGTSGRDSAGQPQNLQAGIGPDPARAQPEQPIVPPLARDGLYIRI